jgi:phospholipid/cholesterol/gamma-HCH transport system substrate-binding protein
MKFTIRYAEQIVGTLIVLAIGILIFVLFMLGSNQRWFSRDYNFKTYFQSASGISQNMPVLYKGFTIGGIKSIKLADDDRVEVQFTVFDTYIDRVRNGSLVDVHLSPIGALGGNQFLFYPGKGTDLLTEGETIPSVGSPEGKQLMMIGLAERPEYEDNINNIIISVGALISDMQEAFEGTQRTSLGRTMVGIEGAATGLKLMAEKLPNDLEDSIDRIMAQLVPVLGNLRDFTDKVANPDSSIAAILDSDGAVYQDLSKSLNALSGTLENLETSSAFIPAQLPQFAALISELSEAVVTAQDVLTSLTNNPLLKRGIPERKETNVGGAYSRNLEF